MANQWTGSGVWSGWQITEDKLVAPDGRAFGPGDIAGTYSQADLAKALGVSRAAITGRINRGTLPPYDGHDGVGRGYWRYETIRHLLNKSQTKSPSNE